MGVEAVDENGAQEQQKPRFWALERPADGKTRGSIYTAMNGLNLRPSAVTMASASRSNSLSIVKIVPTVPTVHRGHLAVANLKIGPSTEVVDAHVDVDNPSARASRDLMLRRVTDDLSDCIRMIRAMKLLGGVRPVCAAHRTPTATCWADEETRIKKFPVATA